MHLDNKGKVDIIHIYKSRYSCIIVLVFLYFYDVDKFIDKNLHLKTKK